MFLAAPLVFMTSPAFALDVSKVDRIYVENYVTICSACPIPMEFRRGTPQDVPPLNGTPVWNDRGHLSFIASPRLFSWLFTLLYHAPLRLEAEILQWAATQSPKLIPYAAFAKGDIRFGDNVIPDAQFGQLWEMMRNTRQPIPGYLA